MNKKQLVFIIIILFFAIVPLCAELTTETHSSKGKALSPEDVGNMSQDELREWLKGVEDIDITWDYLETCNRHFWAEGDINNDGKEEHIGIFFQWEGEGWWSDDIGYVICIFDENGNIVYGKEVVRYGTVKNISIKDNDGDGIKEVVVFCELSKEYPVRNVSYFYEWDGKSYVKNQKP